MKITKGRNTYTGVKEIDEKIVCEKCGKDDRLKFVCHADGKGFYMNAYNCECGQIIQIKTARAGMDKMYWD